MSILFRQLVTRAGKPPPASAGREIYTFWVGNVLPTSPQDRQQLLQTRSTKVRMVLLLRLMTETIEQTRMDEQEVSQPPPQQGGGAGGDRMSSPAGGGEAAGDAAAAGGSGRAGVSASNTSS